MTTQKTPSGRHASRQQREYASEILDRFLEERDISLLLDAMAHFIQTGDFSPYGKRNRRFLTQLYFHRLMIKSKKLAGKQLQAFVSDFANKGGFSEETATRYLTSRSTPASKLHGADQLFIWLASQPNSVKKK